MSRRRALRADQVDVWPFRRRGSRVEFLLLHRVHGRKGPGFWQGVSGNVDSDETAVETALREHAEETGLPVLALYVIEASFLLYDVRRGTLRTVVPFGVEVPASRAPVLSEEHDAYCWLAFARALARLPFEPQRVALRRLKADVLDRPDRAPLFHVPWA
jgi:8-oxo-dGTP pyrophosphatase MutT (NUDIX family)